jgi:hypothetical protein
MILEKLLARERTRKTPAACTRAGDRLSTEEFTAVFAGITRRN